MNFFAAINPSNQVATRDPKFYSELKQLNGDFVTLLDETHKKSPYFDFTPTLNDYIKQFNELDKQYPPGSSGSMKPLFETNSQPLTFGSCATGFTKEESDEECAPPEPQIERYEEPDAKHQIRCKLYERVKNNGDLSFSHIGTGMFYVKQHETNKLQIVVRLEPDLRKVVLNGILTPGLPLKLLDKSVHFTLPSSDGETKIYVAKLSDAKSAAELYDKLTTIKN